MGKIVAFQTLGCKVNQYETEAMAELFKKDGYRMAAFDDAADVYVINTCTVTGLSARKSRQMIRRARNQNRDSIVVAVGCYPQASPGEVSRIEGIDLILGTAERSKIVEYVNRLRSKREKLVFIDDIMEYRIFEELDISNFTERTRAYVKVQEGCTNFCAYCIIPYARGPVRSRNPGNVIKEIKRLAEAGFKEVVITGIHIASYGRDLGNIKLIDLLEMVHNKTSIERIRLGSIEPTTINNEFIDIIGKLPRVCPHFHVSLQSGCDETLKRMNRKYNSSEYKTGLDRLFLNLYDVSVTTDIMVGFPGETDEEFKKTYQYLESLPLMQMHVFKYSPRMGTPAAKLPNQVAPEIKDGRSKILIKLSEQKLEGYLKKYVGRIMNVLFEREETGYMEGRTVNYIKVTAEKGNIGEGEIRKTKLLKPFADYIKGYVL